MPQTQHGTLEQPSQDMREAHDITDLDIRLDVVPFERSPAVCDQLDVLPALPPESRDFREPVLAAADSPHTVGQPYEEQQSTEVVDDDLCTICLCALQSGEATKKMPCCGSGFHKACIDEWLRGSGRCAICRASVPGYSVVRLEPVQRYRRYIHALRCVCFCIACVLWLLCMVSIGVTMYHVLVNDGVLDKPKLWQWAGCIGVLCCGAVIVCLRPKGRILVT
eukprot:gnl/TRDRNA2_/TRDRNA2_176874_c0_seq4.p1 gnl/TRDRNA2_/TRDRNA2_176874_c0~~gnl/TRDRNA2_/TRDRNA2_176874_c0_seq4.p1  ORF type:complete len:222 (+),score=19.23 gnl/TRDRNA2_/TRDRNA2_176874_c0_seq4:99-764(+)